MQKQSCFEAYKHICCLNSGLDHLKRCQGNGADTNWTYYSSSSKYAIPSSFLGVIRAKIEEETNYHKENSVLDRGNNRSRLMKLDTSYPPLYFSCFEILPTSVKFNKNFDF